MKRHKRIKQLKTLRDSEKFTVAVLWDTGREGAGDDPWNDKLESRFRRALVVKMSRGSSQPGK